MSDETRSMAVAIALCCLLAAVAFAALRGL